MKAILHLSACDIHMKMSAGDSFSVSGSGRGDPRGSHCPKEEERLQGVVRDTGLSFRKAAPEVIDGTQNVRADLSKQITASVPALCPFPLHPQAVNRGSLPTLQQ